MYDFIGATQNIAHADGIMIDIGGGSTEIVSFAGRAMQGRWSLPLGSLAMSKAHVAGLLPTREECRTIAAAVRSVLDEAPAVRNLRARHMVGMGGVLSSASRMHALLHPEETPRLLPADALPQMIAMFGSGRPLTEADTAVLLRAARPPPQHRARHDHRERPRRDLCRRRHPVQRLRRARGVYLERDHRGGAEMNGLICKDGIMIKERRRML